MAIDERFARINQNGIDYQVLKYDPETGEPYDWDEAATFALVESTEFFRNPPPSVEPAATVRQRVTRAAFKIAAAQAGLLGQINDFIAQLPFDAPAVILWNDANDFKRSDALWDFMAFQFGVTPPYVDALFNAAGQIDDSFAYPLT